MDVNEKYNEQCGCHTQNISEIKCDAQTCAYHGVGDKCEAGQIRVGGQSAKSPSETACTTFKQK